MSTRDLRFELRFELRTPLELTTEGKFVGLSVKAYNACLDLWKVEIQRALEKQGFEFKKVNDRWRVVERVPSAPHVLEITRVLGISARRWMPNTLKYGSANAIELVLRDLGFLAITFPKITIECKQDVNDRFKPGTIIKLWTLEESA